MPAFEIAGDHPGSRLHHLADAAAALLRLAEAAAELIGKPGMLRPMMPAERLVMRTAIGCDQLDGIFADIGTSYGHETHSCFCSYCTPRRWNSRSVCCDKSLAFP